MHVQVVAASSRPGASALAARRAIADRRVGLVARVSSVHAWDHRRDIPAGRDRFLQDEEGDIESAGPVAGLRDQHIAASHVRLGVPWHGGRVGHEDVGGVLGGPEGALVAVHVALRRHVRDAVLSRQDDVLADNGAAAGPEATLAGHAQPHDRGIRRVVSALDGELPGLQLFRVCGALFGGTAHRNNRGQNHADDQSPHHHVTSRPSYERDEHTGKPSIHETGIPNPLSVSVFGAELASLRRPSNLGAVPRVTGPEGSR